MSNEMMVDLETLGMSPKSKIIQIGWAIFNANEIVKKGCIYVDPNTYPTGIIEWNTIKWWLVQSEKSRKLLTDTTEDFIQTEHALNRLRIIYNRYRCKTIWSHGSIFDIVILKEAFKSFNITIPWSYRDVRDTRTLFDLANLKYKHTANDNSILHYAVDDAVRQAGQVIEAKKKLKG